LSNRDGSNNTASDFQALSRNSSGSDNTANGFQALFNNRDSFENSANGSGALYHNTSGFFNTATGAAALSSNTTGVENTAMGTSALNANTGGNFNTAVGTKVLRDNTLGFFNTGVGASALRATRGGFANTAVGGNALAFNPAGNFNTAVGAGALQGSFGGVGNTALGSDAGCAVTSGDNNILIGNSGLNGESNTIRIGTQVAGTNCDGDMVTAHANTYIAGISGVTVAQGVEVIIDNTGHLGTIVSSKRFKENVQPMDETSDAIFSLQPVTFRYKKELDPQAIPQFGLVAEQVEKVNPDLVARDDEGKPYTVRYEAVNAMLLNEFLKEHRKVETLEATVANLVTTVKEQAAQIQKVSAQLALSRPAAQVAAENP